jgi:hypothetical protein
LLLSIFDHWSFAFTVSSAQTLAYAFRQNRIARDVCSVIVAAVDYMIEHQLWHRSLIGLPAH